MGLALSSRPERFLPPSTARDATASPLVHLTGAARKDRVKPGKKPEGKNSGRGAGDCRKGQSSPDPFLSFSLYKVKRCLRLIAVKRKVNHIINKKKIQLQAMVEQHCV